MAILYKELVKLRSRVLRLGSMVEQANVLLIIQRILQ